MTDEKEKRTREPQHQAQQPGKENEMKTKPEAMPHHPGSGKLKSKAALITGGDGGIGRAVGRCFLHDRSGTSPERRRDHRRIVAQRGLKAKEELCCRHRANELRNIRTRR